MENNNNNANDNKDRALDLLSLSNYHENWRRPHQQRSPATTMEDEAKPSQLNTLNSSGLFQQVSLDKMSVQYAGAQQHGYDVGAVQADRPAQRGDTKAMAESSDFLGFVKRHFEDVKEHWKRNFTFLDYYKKTLGRKEPLPKWTDTDVEEFIASDPIYGPQLKAIRESRKFAAVGAILGAAHLGGISWKYSKSPHGVVLATGFGALCGGIFGCEAAEHWNQLYKIDKQGANLRFLYWWEDKTHGNHQ